MIWNVSVFKTVLFIRKGEEPPQDKDQILLEKEAEVGFCNQVENVVSSLYKTSISLCVDHVNSSNESHSDVIKEAE